MKFVKAIEIHTSAVKSIVYNSASKCTISGDYISDILIYSIKKDKLIKRIFTQSMETIE